MLHENITRNQLEELGFLIGIEYLNDNNKFLSISSFQTIEGNNIHQITFIEDPENKNINIDNRLFNIIIYENLYITFEYVCDETTRVIDNEIYSKGISIPMRNLYEVYKKIREWEIYPNKVEQRDSIIENLIK